MRDGFHAWAFLLTPLWLLLHRLWLAFVIYVIGYGPLGVGLALLRAPTSTQLLVALLVALLMGFEASSIWRWTLARRGWSTLGFVVGDDAETAERRFYAEWSKRAANSPAHPGINRTKLFSAGSARTTFANGRDRPFSRAGRTAVSVAIVDYGSGNLHSAAKAFERAARESKHSSQLS